MEKRRNAAFFFAGGHCLAFFLIIFFIVIFAFVTEKTKSDMKIGDKVRFLNSVGGGIVRGFQGKDQVLVEDEDGFEIPALIRECVVVGDGNEMQVRSANRPKIQAPVEVPAPRKEEPEEVKVEETPGGDRLNVYLAFLPVDPKAFQQTGYEAYFVNDSNYYLSFNYMCRSNNSWTSRYNGLVEPNTKIFMEEFEKADLNELERVCVQLIAFKKDKPYALKNAISVELRLDTVKFYKIHCFMENDYFDEDALLYPIVRDDVPERELLVSAYRTSLELALANGCENIAFPLISSGVYGYPKDQALKVAIDTIEEFLRAHAMTVYLVLFDQAAYAVASKLFPDIAAYVDDRYVSAHSDGQL